MIKGILASMMLAFPSVCSALPLGANFPEWSALSFSRNLPDLEIHDPNNHKTHMSNTSQKVYVCT